MLFNKIKFISANRELKDNDNTHDPAYMFRKIFSVEKGFKKAILYTAGLGLCYHYINGFSVSDDILTPATSDYTKTIWYNKYDVTSFIYEGDNIFASLLGNGFFNESLITPWNYDTAPWREIPKLIYRLDIYYSDKTVVVESDESCKVTDDCYITYNQLRSGEHCDLRKYNHTWTQINYDDSKWEQPVRSSKPDNLVFRELKSQPIRECEIFDTSLIKKTFENTYLFDVGQNISGYIRIETEENCNDHLIIRYAESINNDGTLNLNKMDKFYKFSDFQTDKLICSGKKTIWSPRFTYHGFRYIEISGLSEEPEKNMVKAVFVHQDIERISYFECSDELINRLFKMGINATYSNLFHIPTDCPTREKLGWTNDARASCEQMLINFNMKDFYIKYMQDIYDAMLDNGALPGIIPTSGWGYDWGSGPISSGILFEIPYRYYIYTSDATLLKNSYPFFLKHLKYIEGRKNKEGFIAYGLCDWAGPYEHLEKSPVPLQLTDTIMYYAFLSVASSSADILGLSLENKWIAEKENIRAKIMNKYIDDSGNCIVDEQTAIAMLIFYDLYENIDPLKEQLKRNIEKHDYHHYCGMLGLRHLYEALTKCSLSEYAYKIITANGYPSYIDWITNRDATTLCETFQESNSQNHHMWSDFMAWLMKNVSGIQPNPEIPGFEETFINTYFPSKLSHLSSYMMTPKGKVSVSWVRAGNEINYTLFIPKGMRAKIKLQNAVFHDSGSNSEVCTDGIFNYRLSAI